MLKNDHGYPLRRATPSGARPIVPIVHAAQQDGGVVRTVCGRVLQPMLDYPADMPVTCGLCRRGLRARDRNF